MTNGIYKTAKNQHQEVMDFISRFTLDGKYKDVIDSFSFGCCYWFAYILHARFVGKGTVIMYDQIDNHFGCKVSGKIYDITGDVTEKYDWENWSYLCCEDHLLTQNIKRDCIYF